MTDPYYWFGRRPPAGVTLAWGARAIYDTRGGVTSIDLLWDRQSWLGEERKALSAWLNEKGIRTIKKACEEAGLAGSSAEVVSWSEGGWTIEASPNQSYGYLYLCAYQAVEEVCPDCGPDGCDPCGAVGPGDCLCLCALCGKHQASCACVVASAEEQIAQAIAEFPETFGLRGFPGQRFSLSPRSSYVRGGEVVLYTVTAEGKDFAKGTVCQIRAEVVR